VPDDLNEFAKKIAEMEYLEEREIRNQARAISLVLNGEKE